MLLKDMHAYCFEIKQPTEDHNTKLYQGSVDYQPE